METSALFASATWIVTEAVLLEMPGTRLLALAVAVSVILVPEGVPEITCKTTVNETVFTAPTPSELPSLQVIVPVPPTAGKVGHDQPAGTEIDWNVILGGVFCVKVGLLAVAGPLLVMVWV